MSWKWALQWLALLCKWLWCAVIGSGVHMAMVVMVNNASGIRKAFLKEFINGIIAVQTNVMLHTLEPCSSHVENLRSVWSWSAEMFEAHIHRQTDRQTDRFLAFIERWHSCWALIGIWILCIQLMCLPVVRQSWASGPSAQPLHFSL